MRSIFQFVALMVVVLAVSTASAQGSVVPSKSAIYQTSINSSDLALTSTIPIASLVTLPPQEKVTHHWPWWLRLLAVVGVLVFIRFVAGSVRSKPGGPGPV